MLLRLTSLLGPSGFPSKLGSGWVAHRGRAQRGAAGAAGCAGAVDWQLAGVRRRRGRHQCGLRAEGHHLGVGRLRAGPGPARHCPLLRASPPLFSLLPAARGSLQLKSLHTGSGISLVVDRECRSWLREFRWFRFGQASHETPFVLISHQNPTRSKLLHSCSPTMRFVGGGRW